MNIIDQFYKIPSSNSLSKNYTSSLIIVANEKEHAKAVPLFSKMVERLGLSLEKDVTILALSSPQPPFLQLIDTYQPKRVIICGIGANVLGLQSQLPIHQPVHWRDLFLLRTEHPSRLENATHEMKTAFWNAFKSSFQE